MVIPHALQTDGQKSARIESDSLAKASELQPLLQIVVGVIIEIQDADCTRGSADGDESGVAGRPVVGAERRNIIKFGNPFVVKLATPCMASRLKQLDNAMLQVDMQEVVVLWVWGPLDEARLGPVQQLGVGILGHVRAV